MALDRVGLLAGLATLPVLVGCNSNAPPMPPPGASGAVMDVQAPARPSQTPTRNSELKPPTFFVDKAEEQGGARLLVAIRENMDEEISFNHDYSKAFVSCGSPCFSDWFVNRRTGGVIAVPSGSYEEREMLWDVAAKPDSDVVKLTYGPLDGMPSECTAQHFRLSQEKFIAIDKRAPVKCPK